MFSVIFPNFKENLFCKLLLLYFLLFNLNETCVWCILIFISKFVLPRLFFFNWGYLFYSTCKNNQKTMKESRVKRQRKAKNKKKYSIAKKNLQGFIHLWCPKSLTFEPLPPSSPPGIKILIYADPTLERPWFAFKRRSSLILHSFFFANT